MVPATTDRKFNRSYYFRINGKDVAEFQEELRKGNVDWQMLFYGDAVHSFTQPKAGTSLT